MDNDWKEHTKENPYWLSRHPVQVALVNGEVKEFKCPKCAKWWDKIVVKWREIKTEK